MWKIGEGIRVCGCGTVADRAAEGMRRREERSEGFTLDLGGEGGVVRR